MQLKIASDDGQSVRVAVAGPVTQRELDADRDPLAELLGPSAYSRLVRLDLSSTSLMDSSGIGWLLLCHKRMQQSGGKLTLHAPHPAVSNVIQVLKLERVFEVES
jgi:anti-sigma B factor antagonist